ncbi:hypothetical protein [Streptomyces sp. NPDC048560]|uniref:hypothetical protein n=1 Tax=Streptomyces sp. NPDC048560 TaxID=3155488 RepID=UPI003430FF5A
MNHVLCGLAANEALSSELVDRLIAVADDDLGAVLARRADLSHAQAVELASRGDETAVRLAYGGLLTADDIDPVAQPLVALALLDTRAGRPQWARLLVAHPDHEYREKLAACPDLPADVVENLAADQDVRVVTELALWTTPHVAAALAEHPHAEVRRGVAANEATPPPVLSALITGSGLGPARRCLVCDREQPPFSHDPECPRLDCDLRPGASCDGSHESTLHDIQLAALRNPGTPTEAVIPFVDHPSLLLRWALAARTDLPPEVCRRLAAQTHPGVRADLAENPAIGDAVIRLLAGDPDHEVRRRLAQNPLVPLDVLIRLARSTRTGATLLPRIATATPAEVEELAGSTEPSARLLVARRRDLPAAIRDALATDPDAKVVKSIAPHPGLSDSLLRGMIDRYGVQVAAMAATNPDATPALLEDLTRHEPPAQKAFREVARHRRASAGALLACLPVKRARLFAAGHPALPPTVVADLLSDGDWQVVEAAAANPSLSRAVISAMVP